ncbi:MAG: 2-C-methyl-D-erythritol 4-phosphate cytidylyltransferase [Ruminococcaceae bacterium]|nr:2-C-methyl-D-erythritol 4-phosphate cytidylyltransferase [Oscillospiraceae bacterium]
MKKTKLNKPFVSCIVAAAGKGSRMQAEMNKIFLEFAGKPVLAHTLSVLESCRAIDEIVIVTSECDILGCKDIAEEFGISKVTSITLGGKERQDSVRNALKEVSPQADIVLIHDAARPLVTEEVITDVIKNVTLCGAAAPGVPCKNTLKLADSDGFIADTPDRSHLYEIQTPQGFSRDLIVRAHENAVANNLAGTDDCFLVEQLGTRVKISQGDYRNIKITTPEDLPLAELFYETL